MKTGQWRSLLMALLCAVSGIGMMSAQELDPIVWETSVENNSSTEAVSYTHLRAHET